MQPASPQQGDRGIEATSISREAEASRRRRRRKQSAGGLRVQPARPRDQRRPAALRSSAALSVLSHENAVNVPPSAVTTSYGVRPKWP